MGQGEKLLLVLWKILGGAVSPVHLTLGASQDGVQLVHRPREEVQGLAAVVHRVRQAFCGGGHLVTKHLHASDAALHRGGSQLHCGPQLIQTGLSGELHAGGHARKLPGTRRSSVDMRSSRPWRQGRQAAPGNAGAAWNMETGGRRPMSDFISTLKLCRNVV